MKGTSEIGVMKNGINLIDDDKMKSELFASSFSSVFTRDNGLLPSFPLRTAAVIDDIVFEPFMVEHAFYKLIGKLNTTPDELPAFLLKKMCTAIAFYGHLFFISGRAIKKEKQQKILFFDVNNLVIDSILLPIFAKKYEKYHFLQSETETMWF
uniref:Uncharacterized protein n=1 Tax=Caenorhabditis japonica TaxID=281687 RepID=A0A8R1ED06_CAEJA